MNTYFLPYSLALIAKEKGFYEDYDLTGDVFGWYFKYRRTGDIAPLDVAYVEYNQNFQQWEPEPLEEAPLYSQITDWLREKENVRILEGCPIPPEILKLSPELEERGRYSFYLYNENWNPRIPFYSNYFKKDYYAALNKTIEEAFKLI